MLKSLNLEHLEDRRRWSRLVLLYKVLHNEVSLTLEDLDIQRNPRAVRCRSPKDKLLEPRCSVAHTNNCHKYVDATQRGKRQHTCDKIVVGCQTSRANQWTKAFRIYSRPITRNRLMGTQMNHFCCLLWNGFNEGIQCQCVSQCSSKLSKLVASARSDLYICRVGLFEFWPSIKESKEYDL